jgi:hypothetical protein
MGIAPILGALRIRHPLASMNALTSGPKPSPDAQPASSFIVIYEDVLTGIRAKQFADLIAAATEHDGEPVIALWRHEMLELDELAVAAAHDAERADYLILSLRGDGDLSFATKTWLEFRLQKAPERLSGVIALFDPVRSNSNHTGGIRQYLRRLTNSIGIDFFCACASIDQKRRMHVSRQAASGGGASALHDNHLMAYAA